MHYISTMNQEQQLTTIKNSDKEQLSTSSIPTAGQSVGFRVCTSDASAYDALQAYEGTNLSHVTIFMRMEKPHTASSASDEEALINYMNQKHEKTYSNPC